MDTSTEICPLTQPAIAELLNSRQERGLHDCDCRRRAPRWSFPGTVELWIPRPQGDEYTLATSINLSTTGIGIRSDEPLRPGLQVGIAVHEPEVSFHGRAVVRHCTQCPPGYYLAGLEFLFD